MSGRQAARTHGVTSFMPGPQAVSGVGVSAKGSTATKNASLYIDFGTFGMLVVRSSAKATLDMSVALAKALK